MTHPKSILIVDGYSTSRELVRELRAAGATCLHARSVKTPPPSLASTFDPSPYDRDLGHLGTPDLASTALAELSVSAVLAGSEPGVEYAEELALRMGLPTNNPKSARARRDKQLMGEHIAEAGLRAAAQQLVRSAQEARDWTRSHGSFPIVLKPVDSAGSDGVTVCHSEQEIDRAVDRVLGSKNLLGLTNRSMLAQAFIDGPQYLVNTVSVDGRHAVTDAWLMRGRAVPGFANAMEDWILADPRDPAIQEMFDYTLQAITALGIRNGAAVSEVRLTESGPMLVETGARLNGPAMDRQPYVDAGLEGTQASYLARSLLERDRFAEIADDSAIYEGRNIACSFFIFDRDARIIGVEGLRQLANMGSFHSIYRPLQVGDPVRQTVDTVGRGGVVYWINEDRKQLMADLERFRQIDDQDGFYELNEPVGARDTAA